MADDTQEDEQIYKYDDGKKIYYRNDSTKQRDAIYYLTETLRTIEAEVFFSYARRHSEGAPFLTKNDYRLRLRFRGDTSYELVD